MKPCRCTRIVLYLRCIFILSFSIIYTFLQFFFLKQRKNTIITYTYDFKSTTVLLFSSSDLTIRQLKLNTKICEELLRISDTLEPGITRFRGLLHFYLVRGLKRLQKVENNRVDITLLRTKCVKKINFSTRIVAVDYCYLLLLLLVFLF